MLSHGVQSVEYTPFIPLLRDYICLGYSIWVQLPMYLIITISFTWKLCIQGHMKGWPPHHSSSTSRRSEIVQWCTQFAYHFLLTYGAFDSSDLFNWINNKKTLLVVFVDIPWQIDEDKSTNKGSAMTWIAISNYHNLCICNKRHIGTNPIWASTKRVYWDATLRNPVDQGVVRTLTPLCDTKESYVSQWEHVVILKPSSKTPFSVGTIYCDYCCKWTGLN